MYHNSRIDNQMHSNMQGRNIFHGLIFVLRTLHAHYSKYFRPHEYQPIREVSFSSNRFMGVVALSESNMMFPPFRSSDGYVVNGISEE